MKITLKALKQAGAPAHVIEAVEDRVGSRCHFSFEPVAAGGTVYLDEDARFTFWLPDGTERYVHMAGEWNMTADSVKGVSGAVGKRMPMPTGSWAMEAGYFLGKLHVTVYHWTVPALVATI